MPSTSKDAAQVKLSHVAGQNAKQYSHYGNSLALSCKIKYTLTTYNTAIPFLGFYPSEMKTYCSRLNNGPQRYQFLILRTCKC